MFSGFLVRTFLKYVEPNYFFVEASWLHEKLASCYQNPESLVSDDASWVCTVLMVLAVGTQYTHMEAGLSNNFASSFNSHDCNELSSEDDVGRNFYHAAAALLPDVIACASVESVQACLLLAQYALPLDTHGLAYTYLGLSLSLAIQNGLHRKSAGTNLDRYTMETRSRLWWTVYSIEKRICILHGRPVPIAHSEIDADLPQEAVAFQVGQTSTSVATMSAMISLTLRLGEIAHRM